MAYNLNPNPYYGKPAYGVQPRQAANQATFGHQASGILPLYSSPYSSGAYPAPYAGAQGMPLRAAYPAQAPKPSVYPLPNIPPLAALPKPGQIFTPSASAGFKVPSGISNTTPPPATGMVSPGGKPAAEKPAVQNYYYTLPTGKTPPSRKKDLKKFLFITGAVITGMITTAGLAIGALFIFAPNQTHFFRKLGARPFAWANQGLQAFKKTEGSLVSKALASGRAVCDAIKKPQEPAESLWTKLKQACLKRFNPEKAKEYAAKQAKSNQEQANRPILQQGEIAGFLKGVGDDDVKAVKELFKKGGLDLENQSIGSILADTFNKSDPKQIAEVLKNMMGQAEGGKSFDMAGLIAGILNRVEPDRLQAMIPGDIKNALLDKIKSFDLYKLNYVEMSKALSTFFNSLPKDQQEKILTEMTGKVPSMGATDFLKAARDLGLLNYTTMWNFFKAPQPAAAKDVAEAVAK